MRPQKLNLQPEYLAEFLDPWHRVQAVSNRLYEIWQAQASSTSFAEWLTENPMDPKKNEQVRYITDPQELKNLEVFFEASLAEQRPLVNRVDGTAEIEVRRLSCERNLLKKSSIPIALVIHADNQRLYAMSMNTTGDIGYKIHHSSLALGQDVFFAAEAFVNNGKFITITDKSGHYKPDLYCFVFGIEFMLNHGANLSDTGFELTRQGDNVNYANGAEFIKLYIEEGFSNPKIACTTLASLELSQTDYQTSKQKSSAIYFIKDLNELYEFSTGIDNKLQISSFTNKYQSRIAQIAAEREAQYAASASSADSELFFNDDYTFTLGKRALKLFSVDASHDENNSDSEQISAKRARFRP